MSIEVVEPLLPPKPQALPNCDGSEWMDAQNSLKTSRRSAAMVGCGAQLPELPEPKQGDYYRPKTGTSYFYPGAGYTFLRMASDSEGIFRADHSGQEVRIPLEQVERVRL